MRMLATVTNLVDGILDKGTPTKYLNGNNARLRDAAGASCGKTLV